MVLLKEAQLTTTQLHQTIIQLLNDSAALAKLAEAIGKLNTTDAADQLAKIILRYEVPQS
ncbi:MAG: hypothetical protein ACD_43C00017G0001 [uncultured bacterium]|nr:MAG: hypothetical protein ACD_43C00017G0001 [uncultured bacterium]